MENHPWSPVSSVVRGTEAVGSTRQGRGLQAGSFPDEVRLVVGDGSRPQGAPASPSAIDAGTQRQRILGIDVGTQGAAALLTAAGDLLDVSDLPVTPDGPRSRPAINGALLAELLREWHPDRAFVELVTARPTDSRVGAFSFGLARGTVEATLATLGIAQQSIAVPTWKRAVGIPPGAGQKTTARSEAIRRWPAHAAKFARVRDDGRAESALIALAGILRERRP